MSGKVEMMDKEVSDNVLEKYNLRLLELQKKLLNPKTKKLEQFIEIKTEMKALTSIL